MSVSLVAGVPGVGVSSIVSQAAKELDGHRLFNFGDAMLEQAASMGLAASRDELSSLSLYEQEFLQVAAAEYLRDESSGGSLIVNTRFVVRTPHGFMQGLPDKVLHEMNPDRLILVEASPDSIEERREVEEYRDYPGSLETEIRFHQQMNRTAAFVYASKISATMHHIMNEDEPEIAANKLVQTLEQE